MPASAQLSPVALDAPLSLEHRGAEVCSHRHVFVVCSGDSCRHAGSDLLLGLLQRGYAHPAKDQEVRISSSKCLQRCGIAPAMVKNGRVVGWVSLRGLKSELLRLGLFPAAA
jgi:NADH:ubiquinone oxidoreductase subunit E